MPKWQDRSEAGMLKQPELQSEVGDGEGSRMKATVKYPESSPCSQIKLEVDFKDGLQCVSVTQISSFLSQMVFVSVYHRNQKETRTQTQGKDNSE